ncbi:MAG: anacyclamide/piricyclamide family prenylated cyclic peptide [Oscillatoria sp. SIO1A7]|nr:anacyclamide/piricyclamide family prenylated cyclic peptide [Oscillatoria sp. SIO1A7]
MKTKTLTPRNAAPVKREKAGNNGADGNAIVPNIWWRGAVPFAGDDAE